MSKFIGKYANSTTRTKFVKTVLPIQPLMDIKNFPTEVNVYPITVGIEMKLYSGIKNLIDKNIPLQFIMFEDIIEDIVDTQDQSKVLRFSNLTLYDINYIIYNTRILSYGNTQELRLTCENCKDFYEKQVDLQDNNEEIQKLIKQHHIKNYNSQIFLTNKDFYVKPFEQNLLNQQITVPDKKEEIFIDFTTANGIKLKICPPRMGWFNELKGYLIDFRKTIEEFYTPNNIKIESEEEEYNTYSVYANLQLFIYSIDGEIVEPKDVGEIPILIKSMLTKKDISELSEKLKYYEKFNLKIPFEYKCPNCGDVIKGDATSFPFEYVFNVSSKF